MTMSKSKAYKPSKIAPDKKTSLIAYVLTLIAAVAARTFQLQNNMNFSTGKYIDSSIGKNYTLWALIIGFALIFLIMTFGRSKDKVVKSCILVNPMRLDSDRLNKKISPVVGAVMFLMALLMAFDIFLELSVVINRNKELSTEANPVSSFAGISVLQWFVYITAVISILTFVSLGTNLVKNEGFTKGNCVFLSFYAIYQLLRVFDMINRNQILGAYSEKVYIMLTAMSSAAFFLFAAKFYAGFEKKHTRFWMCIFGYAASIFAAVSTLPRYIMYFTVNYRERDGMATPNTSDIGIIFATVALITVFWGTYVYRVMPKLNLMGRRRWNKLGVSAVTKGDGGMQSIDK